MNLRSLLHLRIIICKDPTRARKSQKTFNVTCCVVIFRFSLNTIQARALICLNNIVSALDANLLGGEQALGQLWTSLFNLTFYTKSKLVKLKKTSFKFFLLPRLKLRQSLSGFRSVDGKLTFA